MPSTVLISTGLMRWECATVTECRTPSRDFCQNSRKALQLREIWVEVVVLPDVALQQPGMVRAPVQDIRRVAVPFYLLLKILRGHENLQVLEVQVFIAARLWQPRR